MSIIIADTAAHMQVQRRLTRRRVSRCLLRGRIHRAG